MSKKLRYVSTSNLNHDLVEYPKGAILEFDESEATRIDLLKKGLIIPAKTEDLISAPESKKVEVFKSTPNEKELRKAAEDKAAKDNEDKPNDVTKDKKEIPDGPLINPNENKNIHRGFCRKCKKEQDVLNATFTTSANKRTFIKGICAVCKSNINSICKKAKV